MKFAAHICILAFLLLVLMLTSTACPSGIAYAPGYPGKEKLDKKLLGTWVAQESEAEIQKVSITQRDDYSYLVEILEVSENFMADDKSYTSWVTVVGDQKLLYSKAEEANEYFTYQYEMPDKATLIIHDISLLVNGVDGIYSTEDFRQEIDASLKLPDCLTSPFTYSRAE
jgi:hypothetical protein